MTQEEIRQYIAEKWSNYSRGLAMSFAFRKDKNYTFEDVKYAFESGAYEFQQLLYRSGINMDELKWGD